MDAVTAPGSFADIVLRLALATVFGATVGLNRERLGKPAGFRTFALVALGAAQLTVVALLFGTGDAGAPGRVLQGVIVGVGFIGAGVILHRSDARTVQGLTTAAAIWVVAAVGVATGAGLWRTAGVSIVLVLAMLTAGEVIDRWLHRNAPPD